MHNLRAATGSTNWQAVVQLYDGLVQLAPTTGTAVARAAAHHRVDGPDVALRLLDALAEEVGTAVAAYQPYWVLRALCEGELGRASAGDSARRAVELTPSPQVAAYLRRTLPGLPAPP